MTIPSGYQLHITSWTNDADNYNTTIHNGLSYEDVTFLLEIVKPFKSEHQNGQFGNNDECTHEVNDHIYDCWLAHQDSKSSKYEEWFSEINKEDPDVDGLSDLAYDLVGRDEYCGWRVFESAKVYYYPTAVEDVTKQFIKKAKQ